MIRGHFVLLNNNFRAKFLILSHWIPSTKIMIFCSHLRALYFNFKLGSLENKQQLPFNFTLRQQRG